MRWHGLYNTISWRSILRGNAQRLLSQSIYILCTTPHLVFVLGASGTMVQVYGGVDLGYTSYIWLACHAFFLF